MATPAGFGFGRGSGVAAPAPASLPEGWSAVLAPDGRTYYANPKTGETTWVKPEVPKISIGDEVDWGLFAATLVVMLRRPCPWARKTVRNFAYEYPGGSPAAPGWPKPVSLLRLT